MSSSWLMVTLWVLWIATALQCGIAVNGYLTEKEHGMKISRLRVGVVAGAFLLATLLVSYALLLPQDTVITASEPSLRKPGTAPQVTHEVARLQAELKQEEEQRIALAAREQETRSKLFTAEGQAPNSVPTAIRVLENVNRPDRTLLAVIGTALLMVVGFLILAVGGQIQTLFPEGFSLARGGGRDRDAAKKEIGEVSSLVWNEKYREALLKAEAIADRDLTGFDRFDLLFLRGYAAVQAGFAPQEGDTDESMLPMRNRAVSDLEAVIERAPNRGEAWYTLALAYGQRGNHAEAVRAFDQASRLLTSDKSKLPFPHNISVCLLHLAEQSLRDGDTQQAESHFRRVAELGALADSVVQSRLRVGMINLRAAMARQDMQKAASAINELGAMSDLSNQQVTQVGAVRSSLNALIALRQDDPQTALNACTDFIARHLPSGLPMADDDAADEMFSSILEADLPFPRELFFGFLLMKAVCQSRLETRGRHKLTEAQIAKLAEPLLRALQFAPRQRDVLGSLGGLYYWFRPEKRDKAREWLESAATMGVGGRIVRAILERDRMIEMERREALDWFRSASSRFLRDPTIANQVRGALVEELGRFQEFQPLLISLREQPEPEAEEPTMEVLRERGRYLADLIAGFAARGNSERFTQLAQTHAEYVACLTSLEAAIQKLTFIESRVFSQMGETLVLI